MKSTTIKFIALCAVSMLASTVFAAGSIKVTVNGMVCAFCAQGIEKRLGKLPAAQAVFVDLKKRVVAVEAKPGQKLDDKLIRAEITDAGYDVVKLEASELTVQQIKSEMAGKK
jgi:copper chaperone CopZ